MGAPQCGGGEGGAARSPETALCELGTPKPPREAPPLPLIAPPPLPVSPLPHFASVYPLPPSPPSRYHLRSALLCAALPALPAAGSSPRLRFRSAPFPAGLTSASGFPAHIRSRPWQGAAILYAGSVRPPPFWGGGVGGPIGLCGAPMGLCGAMWGHCESMPFLWVQNWGLWGTIGALWGSVGPYGVTVGLWGSSGSREGFCGAL